ncbi:Zn-ribbon domain-containing OB-fold protein [Mycobacterium sp. 21AC1]|uniref:Zn-ribbon domain-containing OB-fold protein n=1 Tax=[Mycobacterium] appelbergii TaxID=2939269 RepID=UPI0029391F9E|nr:Zn-ribbon domain-containing OB-fold protein [Mycobacterium sp. 21AC1]MDV3124629.1 Zn-ribbon domain-containing OB-fold protein [Mycobacterium sp. 21AC1]
MKLDTGYQRPQLRLAPSPTAESQAFWTGGEGGELLINRCHRCGRFFHPPGPACWRCRSTDVAPEPVSGRGKVATFTVNRQPWIPGFEPPYIVAMVELDDEPDVRLITNVVGVSADDVRIGMAVEVFFEDWTALSGEEDTRVWLPLFRPIRTA